MDDTFISLPKLFVDEMIKMDELPYKRFGSVIKSCEMKQRQSTNVKNVYFNRKRGKFFGLC